MEAGPVIYVFRADDGEEIEEHFPMAGAPGIGSPIVRGGKRFVRVFSALLRIKEGHRSFGAKYPYASHALARWTKPTGMDMKFDKKGKPIIQNAKVEQEYASRMTNAGHPMEKK